MLIRRTALATEDMDSSEYVCACTTEPIRVLHVVSNMDRCGMQSMIMNYYRHIDRQRIQFDFLCHYGEGDYEDEITSLGGKIFRIANPDLLHPWRYSRNLRRFYHSHPEYRVVHSHLDKRSGIILKEARACGIPIRIAHSHSTRNPPGIMKNLYKNYASLFIKQAANRKIACCKESGCWLFGKHDVQTNRVTMLPNAIEPERYAYDHTTRMRMRKMMGIPKETFVIVHVGSFTYPKNHRFIIELAQALTKRTRNMLFILIGDGPLRNEIEALVAEKDLSSSFRLTGTRSDIADILQASDLFVLPSRYEGFPLTMVEAQAAGLPCIVSDRITPKADLTGLVEYLSIDHGVAPWVDRISSVIPSPRKSGSEQIVAAGFSIAQAAKVLEEIYRGE